MCQVQARDLNCVPGKSFIQLASLVFSLYKWHYHIKLKIESYLEKIYYIFVSDKCIPESCDTLPVCRSLCYSLLCLIDDM